MSDRCLVVLLMYQENGSFKTLDTVVTAETFDQFLAMLPETLDRHSQLWLGITNNQGDVVSYVDGMDVVNSRGKLRMRPLMNSTRKRQAEIRSQAQDALKRILRRWQDKRNKPNDNSV